MKPFPHIKSSLEDEVNAHGVPRVAERLGLTRSAIIQMIDADRKIYLKEIDGLLHYCEFKDWKRGSANKKAATA